MRVNDIEINRYLGYEHTVRVSSDPAPESGMSRVPAECLEYDHTVMGLSGCLESADHFGDPVDRGVSAHTVCLEVKVHGLWCMYACYALGREVDHNASRVIAPAYHEAVDIVFFKTFFDTVVFVLVSYLFYLYPGVACLGPCQLGTNEIQPLLCQDSNIINIDKVIKARVAVGYCDRLYPHGERHLCGALDDAVQSAAVTSACNNAYSLNVHMKKPPKQLTVVP
ncbi:hypothetical protein BMS3Abin09_00143 [bacterium BMS3Abin09]|nr:hypothetical protein BMS3Abin09_00143 [bacterium BMS3Abin09]